MFLRIAAVATVVAAGFGSLSLRAERPTRSVEIVVERSQNDGWIPVDPRTVFKHGDEIRFRVKTDFSGFLYVMNRTPAGEQHWLFPTAEAGTANAIEAGRDYTIPATEGSFEIPEKPGYDVVFWIVSPAPLNGLTGLPAPEPTTGPLLPRCRATLSPCLDPRAGPQSLEKRDADPVAGEVRARDLAFDRVKSELKTRISTRDAGALMYQIRIAHR